MRGCSLELVGGMAYVRRVAAELLAKRHRHGVLKMRAASLEDGGKAAALFGQAVRQFPRGRDEIAQLEEDRQPRRRRIHVVGRLSHVDVIVGVHPPVGATTVPEDLGGAVGKHLVRVHVVRGAGARLVDVDDKLIAQPPLEHVVGGPDDRAGKRRREAAEPPVGLAAAFLIRMVAVMSDGGAVKPLIGKFSTARAVCPP